MCLKFGYIDIWSNNRTVAIHTDVHILRPSNITHAHPHKRTYIHHRHNASPTKRTSLNPKYGANLPDVPVGAGDGNALSMFSAGDANGC